MNYSLNTGVIRVTGPTEDVLRMTAKAGFTHVHWCHHWCDDFVYSEPEIEEIARQLAQNGLKLANTHGSAGAEKCWFSPRRSCRLAGVELIKNRVALTARLGGDCVVMHGPEAFQPKEKFEAQRSAMEASLDELEDDCHDCGIRLALENFSRAMDYERLLPPTIEARSPEYLGFCYDSGHHNIDVVPEERGRKNDIRDRLAERLLVVHISDNNGYEDNHWLPFTGTMDWADVRHFLHLAHYEKPLTLELSFPRSDVPTPEAFIRKAYAAAVRLQKS